MNPADEDDVARLAAYRRGDVAALGALVEKYKRPLYSFLLRFAASPDEAEEWFQETWVRGIRHMNRFRGGRLLSWLFRIAHNLVIDQARRNKPELTLDAPLCAAPGAPLPRDAVVDGAALPDRAAALQDLRARMDAAVAKLPLEQREVFLLRTQAQLPFREIAGIQRCSLNTALARMQYALEKLRSELAADYREWQEMG